MADTDRDELRSPRHEPARANGARAPLATTNKVLGPYFGIKEKETTIAVNPANPLNILAGAICTPTNCFYSSSDGGQTWTWGQLPPPTGFTSFNDPVVTFCGDGSAYFTGIGLSGSGASTRSGIFVFRSTDGGLTWPTRSTVVDRVSDSQSISDKPWIVCDATGSAFNGRIYVEYTDPLLVPSGTCTTANCRAVKIHRSVDQGATWSSPVMVSDNPQTPQNQGSLAIGPNGEFYVAWNYFKQLQGYSIHVDKSTNGGVSFGTDVVANAVSIIAPDPFFNRLTYPVMDVDRSNGPYRGRVYIAWSDNRNGDPDILLIRSTDGGATWSAPVRVNDDTLHNGGDQWAQGLAVDPLGRVIVTFYDRRRYIGTEMYEIWGAISRDGGQTFDTNFLIGDTPSDVTTSRFLGDYDSVAATADHLYPTWADMRVEADDTPDVYTDLYRNMFGYDEVDNVTWSSATDMGFDTEDARFGVDLDYDVTGGLVSELRADHTFARAGCVSPLWPAPPFVDARVPPEGDGYYYLVRAHGAGGVGTYGDASPARPNPRDALDETLITCP